MLKVTIEETLGSRGLLTTKIQGLVRSHLPPVQQQASTTSQVIEDRVI